MSKQTRWLLSEIERWTAEKIISAEQAARIRALYPEAAPAVSWGLIVFSGLGAVVIGLGVILLLAYNWQDIPKFGKLGLIFGATAAAHAAGLKLRSLDGWRPRLGEVFSLLGTMLFGAGIWLVAQVYNIEEHFPNGFLMWGLGALAMAWVLDSVPQGLLAAILITIWGGSEAIGFDAPVDWSWLLIAAALGPLVWRLRSALLLAVVLAALYVLLLINAGHWGGGGGAFSAAFSLSALLIAAGKFVNDETFPGGRRVMAFFGLTGFLVCCYMLSFYESADSFASGSDTERETTAAFAYRMGLFIPAITAWAWLLWRTARGSRGLVAREEWLCPIALIYSQGLVMTGWTTDGRFVAIIFNLIFLSVAMMWMVRGCREGRLRPTVLGSLLFAALVWARYFDLFESLAARGLVFVVLGAILFAEGFYYRQMRQRADAAGKAGA